MEKRKIKWITVWTSIQRADRVLWVGRGSPRKDKGKDKDMEATQGPKGWPVIDKDGTERRDYYPICQVCNGLGNRPSCELWARDLPCEACSGWGCVLPDGRMVDTDPPTPNAHPDEWEPLFRDPATGRTVYSDPPR